MRLYKFIWEAYSQPHSCPAGIPAKKSCEAAENKNSCNPLQNHVPVKKSSGKRWEKRNPKESCQERFLGSKKENS
jgi:hypothetical protein